MHTHLKSGLKLLNQAVQAGYPLKLWRSFYAPLSHFFNYAP